MEVREKVRTISGMRWLQSLCQGVIINLGTVYLTELPVNIIFGLGRSTGVFQDKDWQGARLIPV